jgi:tight adherence protein C
MLGLAVVTCVSCRRRLAEEKAAKLIFPLVIFIFSGIFVVFVGPAAITMVRQIFPMMQGK